MAEIIEFPKKPPAPAADGEDVYVCPCGSMHFQLSPNGQVVCMACQYQHTTLKIVWVAEHPPKRAKRKEELN